MTRKEIELALRKKDKKLMSEEFDTKFNKVISDRKTLYLLSEQYKYEQTRDKAAITIQRYFRRKKESKITNLAQMAKKKF
jgi:hypothetical protein